MRAADSGPHLLCMLVRLYGIALELRSPETADWDLDGESTDDATWRRIYERAASMPFQLYGEVFDPHVMPPEEAVVCDLADDIADIHRDLTKGLSLYERGHAVEAEWEFAFQFRIHWGRHATDAIRALHNWMIKVDSWPGDESPGQEPLAEP